MEVGGVVQEAFKVVYGNPYVMFFILSFTVVSSLVFASIEVYQKSR